MPEASAVEGSLLAENMALGVRLQRLSPVLAAMARDLAAACREAAALRRENAHLSAHVGGSAGERTTSDGVLCDSCGVAVPARALADRLAGAR